MIAHNDVLEWLDYNPWTGFFTWRKRPSPTADVNERAGTLLPNGYRQIKLKGKKYGEHRLVWFWMTGKWPAPMVDHENGIKSDNRWKNLREASRSTNAQNLKGATSRSRTGLLGVVPLKNGRYQATIWVDGVHNYLGVFQSAIEAHRVYLDAKRLLHSGNTL